MWLPETTILAAFFQHFDVAIGSRATLRMGRRQLVMRLFSEMFQFAERLVWPERCVACSALTAPEQTFCSACAAAVVPLVNPCPRCALPAVHAAEAPEGHACAPCLSSLFPFETAFAPFVYGGALTSAILRLKHGGSVEVASSLGRRLAAVFRAGVRFDLAAPVPLHPARLRDRGFNQAYELLLGARRHARQVAPRGYRDALPRVVPDLLCRLKDTQPLGRQAPAVRRARLAGMFSVSPGVAVRGQRILLVDDVMTSGATLAECAATLLATGARSVGVAAVARAVL